jgi:hypothetical protein
MGVRKICDAVAGSRHPGSEGTVENYVNCVGLFRVARLQGSLKRLGISKTKVDAGEKIDAYVLVRKFTFL